MPTANSRMQKLCNVLISKCQHDGSAFIKSWSKRPFDTYIATHIEDLTINMRIMQQVHNHDTYDSVFNLALTEFPSCSGGIIVHDVYTHENLRGKGIAGKMLDWACNACFDCDYNCLIATIVDSNANSIKLFTARDFKLQHTFYNRHSRHNVCIYMRSLCLEKDITQYLFNGYIVNGGYL